MPRASLDYETPRPMDIARRKYRRYAKSVFLGSLAIGVLLALGWIWAVLSGSAHHARWVNHLEPASRKLIGAAAFFAPLMIAAELISRARKNVYGPEMAAQAAEERRLRNEEKAAAVGWKVPKYADGEWRTLLLATAGLYVLTFVLVLAITPFILLLDRGTHEDMSALRAAFYCADVVGIAGPAFFMLALLFVPRAKVTLISERVLE